MKMPWLKSISWSVLAAWMILVPTWAVASLDRNEAWSVYREGEASFRQATELMKSDPGKARELFQKAALAFERLNREGSIENGKLYYNIGNIHFRLGDLGRAILNYRKAERLTPHDANLQQNLDYARSRCVDKIEARPQARVFHTLFFWHYDFSLVTRAFLFLVFLNLTWCLGGVALFRPRPWLRRSILGCCLAGSALAVSIGIEAWQEAAARPGVVLAPEIVARKGDSTTFDPTFKEPLHAGTEFTVVEERKGWYHIELPDGRRCWIPESSAGLVV